MEQHRSPLSNVPPNIPTGDTIRQAVDSLRGYLYQVTSATLEWLRINDNSKLFLEVAEDYATIVDQAMRVTQVKDTRKSGRITLNSEPVRKAVESYIGLVKKNPDTRVEFRYLTTSEIGSEQPVADRPSGMSGLKYWEKAAAGSSVEPLRRILESDRYAPPVRQFCSERNDECLRRDLIKRIRWDCGKPDSDDLRKEIESCLVVVCRDSLDIPAGEARQLADSLCYQVLRLCTRDRADDRVLTRADLYNTIDDLTSVSVPRSFVRRVTGATPSIDEGRGRPLIPFREFIDRREPSWFVSGGYIPAARGTIARVSVERAVSCVLDQFGGVVLFGGMGVGKSIVARAVCATRAEEFYVVDFDDVDEKEARYRLDMTLGRLGGLQTCAVVLEDLNHLSDTLVQRSLAIVIGASRRYGYKIIITCHRRPSASTVGTVGLDGSCVVECPCFDEEETRSLVTKSGGDSDTWGGIAHTAGGMGHPQLTHAFVKEMETRGWPTTAIEETLRRGLSSDDTDAARHGAGQRLMSQLPIASRRLLYRLSLSVGSFNRALALAVGEVHPALTEPGEHLNQLIGPWIAIVGNDRLRVSPVASKFGADTLPPKDQERVHQVFARSMVGHDKIDPRNGDAILIHSILGRETNVLWGLAFGVLQLDRDKRALLTEHLSIWRSLQTERPIYEQNPSTSAVVRMAQFQLVAAAGDGAKARRVVRALFEEIGKIPASDVTVALEAKALLIVLNTMGVANLLDDWISLLSYFRTQMKSNEVLRAMWSDGNDARNAGHVSLLGLLFAVGSTGLQTVGRLERIVDALDAMEADERSQWLEPIDSAFADCGVFVNSPWTSQRRRDDFDASEAAMAYRRMASKTRRWNIRAVSLQCSAAEAAIIDEYQGSKERAIAVVEEAEEAMGKDPILGRALANIHSRHEAHCEALKVYLDIAAQEVGSGNAVARVFALRSAAVCGAMAAEWSNSEQCFLEARSAALGAGTKEMDLVAIGLGADAAMAALEGGRLESALRGLTSAVDGLADVDPEGTVREAYCHRVIRQAVVWAQSRVTRPVDCAAVEGMGVEAGICSNPHPAPGIKEIGIQHLDVTWYVLATTETNAGVDVGITATLSDRLAGDPIVVLEGALRSKAMQNAVGALDARRFVYQFLIYVVVVAYAHKHKKRIAEMGNPPLVERQKIQGLIDREGLGPIVEGAARDAIMAFLIHAVIAGRPVAMEQLENALHEEIGESYPGKAIFEYLRRGSQTPQDKDQLVVSIVKMLAGKGHMRPDEIWIAGAALFRSCCESIFEELLTSDVGCWLRSQWERIVGKEAFRVSQPKRSVPLIRRVLKTPRNDKRFVAKMLLATSEGLEFPLEVKDREFLRRVVAESEETSANK